MEYEVGQKAVYPGHGVGVITAVENLDIEGVQATVYVLKILDNGMTIRVPLTNVETLGMRPVMTMEHFKRLVHLLHRHHRAHPQRLHVGERDANGHPVVQDLQHIHGG
ncbi:MAG: CarD family transcriptional regulator, partial [Myxococcota bacterium]